MKIMTQLVSDLALAVGFAGFLAINLVAVPASAQTRAALTQNVDEKGRVPFQQLVSAGCPSGASRPSSCSTSMNVPAAQRLVITHVNARLANGSAGASIIGTIIVQSSLPSNLPAPFPSVSMDLAPTRISGATATSGAFFIVDEELTMFADANTSVTFQFGAVDGSNVNGSYVELTITGYLVSAN